MLGHFRILGIIGLRRTQEALKGDQGRFEGQNWGPSVLEDIKTNRAGSRGDVGVVDFRYELHLHRLEWIRFRNYDVLAKKRWPSYRTLIKWLQKRYRSRISVRLQTDHLRMVYPQAQGTTLSNETAIHQWSQS